MTAHVLFASFKLFQKRWLLPGIVFISLTALTGKSKAQEALPDFSDFAPAVSSKKVTQDWDRYSENPPEFPGGLNAFGHFVFENFKVPRHTPDGRIIATFLIQKDGTIGDIKIIRGLTPKADKEVLRVLKLSPRWQPGSNGNEPRATRYTFPFKFRNGKMLGYN